PAIPAVQPRDRPGAPAAGTERRPMEDIMLRDLTTEELLHLYVKDHDPKVRTTIIERHDALVRSLAHKFARPGVPVEDLVQSAWIALIGALDRFDPTHETKFSTYAVH